MGPSISRKADIVHGVARTRVLEPAEMGETGFPRSDEPGSAVAHDCLPDEGLRTNVLHLPVRGTCRCHRPVRARTAR